MKTLVLLREAGGDVPAKERIAEVHMADTWWHRLRGLLLRPRLGQGQGLLLRPCASVHTLGMRYPLDLLFLDREGRVLRCVEGLKPFRAAFARGTGMVVELAPGAIAKHKLVRGDRLQWREERP